MATVTKAMMIPIAKIEAPDEFRRKKTSAVEADTLRKSIEQGGIQIPLVVSRMSKDKYVLIEGYRRLDIATHLNMTEVPCVIYEIPEGVTPDEYRRRVRFVLDEHRQDPEDRQAQAEGARPRLPPGERSPATGLNLVGASHGSEYTLPRTPRPPSNVRGW